MSRRRFLALMMTVVSFFGLALVGKVFMSSLNPSAKAISEYESSSVLDVSGMKENETKEFALQKTPLYVRKINENDFIVFLRIVRFSDKNTHGCIINMLPAARAGDDFYPKNTAFMEGCRGVFFDNEGNILQGSHGAALPMQRLKWEWESSENRRIKVAT